MLILWSTDRQRFEAKSEYHERNALSQAGFRWDPKAYCWHSSDEYKAARLIDHATDGARARLEKAETERQETVEKSRAIDMDIEVPAPAGLQYKPFQRGGIAWTLAQRRVLIGDEMGLGKTIEVLGAINCDPSMQRVLVICPASLKINWRKEASKWLVRKFEIDILHGTKGFRPAPTDPTAGHMVIVNYDILKKHSAALRSVKWDLLVSDECHMIKNPKAQRTKQIIGDWDKKSKSWKVEPLKSTTAAFLTGTPIQNKPVELFTILHYLDPKSFPSWWSYTGRFCNRQQTRWGLDVTGSSNLGELQELLRSTVMIRRLKKDVLTELPPKQRQILEIAPNGSAGAVKRESEVWARVQNELVELAAAVELAKASENLEEYKEAVAALRAGQLVAFNEMSKVRHETAVAKVPAVISHLASLVNDDPTARKPTPNGYKVVVFGHHVDVIKAIKEAFGDRAVLFYGSTKMEDRDAAVERFQNDPTCQIFIGQTQAAGVGITLTASSHVVFAELDWVPGALTQAEDRCHRIGQHDNVLVQHIVLEGSLDATMADRIVEKQEAIDAALDDPIGDIDRKIVVLPTAKVATASTSRKKVEEIAATLEPGTIEAIHTALGVLAASCDGALSLDGMGFNKMDSRIGKSLAAAPRLSPKQAALGQRLVNKYRGQLVPSLVETATQKGA